MVAEMGGYWVLGGYPVKYVTLIWKKSSAHKSPQATKIKGNRLKISPV
jgi:hypothetical protein